MHVRVCRDCGEEYRPEIARCADCGGELVDRYEDEEAPGAETPPGIMPPPGPPPEPAWDPSASRAIFSAGSAGEVEPLAEKLGAARIPFGVRARFQAFELLVREEDLERAAAELAPFLGVAEGEGLAAATDEGAPAESRPRCPACGSGLPPGAGECPDCGLAVGEGPEGRLCPQCARPLGPDETECPRCGPGYEGA